MAEEYFDGGREHAQAIRRGKRRRPYAIRVRMVDLLSASSVMGVCATAGLAAGGVALATPPPPVFVAVVAVVPVALLLVLFSRRPAVFEVNDLGLRFGVGGLTGRLMRRDAWFPGRGRPVIVRWGSISDVVIRSGPATGDSRVTAEVGVIVNDGVKVPSGWARSAATARVALDRPVPTQCPYWQRFPPGKVDLDELTAAIALFGEAEPIRPDPRPEPYHMFAVRRLTALGAVLGLLAWAAAVVVRLLGGDGGLAVFAAPLLAVGGIGLGITGMRRDRRLVSFDDGGLRFGRPVAFVPWSHVERAVVDDGRPPGTVTLALRLGPESRLPRLYERRLAGADPVALATGLSVWLPGRIRLIRALRG
ncbi:MAG TPA: hypothetical protein VFU43_26290 [Streptosporangiaceae bacterium]|nr:hypothetical protein [Streptosporangiaceae bacterium]